MIPMRINKANKYYLFTTSDVGNSRCPAYSCEEVSVVVLQPSGREFGPVSVEN